MDQTENAIKKKGTWLQHEGECIMNPHSYPSICHKCDFEMCCDECGNLCCGMVLTHIEDNDTDLCPDCAEEAEIIKYSEEKRKREQEQK